MTTTTIRVAGMTCSHCVNAVAQELQALEGVETVTVDLITGGASPVVITSRGPLADEAVRAALDEAGYDLADD